MGQSPAVMTARYTGEIPLDEVQEALSRIELQNMGAIGKTGTGLNTQIGQYRKTAALCRQSLSCV